MRKTHRPRVVVTRGVHRMSRMHRERRGQRGRGRCIETPPGWTDPFRAARVYKRDLIRTARHILISGILAELARPRQPLRKYQLAKYRALAVAINATQIFSPFAAGPRRDSPSEMRVHVPRERINARFDTPLCLPFSPSLSLSLSLFFSRRTALSSGCRLDKNSYGSVNEC